MNEIERVVAMLESGNLGIPSRAAKLIRNLARENHLMRSTIERVERHLDFTIKSKIKPDPEGLMKYFEEMREKHERPI